MKRVLKILLCAVLLSVLLLPNQSQLAQAASYSALRPGDTGTVIKTLQEALSKKGYYTYGKVTGYYGENTTLAVMKLQKKYNLSEDGMAGESTLRLLFGKEDAKAMLKDRNKNASATQKNQNQIEETALRAGDRSDEVKKVQKKLRDLGFFDRNESITGYFGDKTQQAVRNFQWGHALSGDGVVGKATYSKLFSSAAKSYDKVKSIIEKAQKSDKTQGNTKADQVIAYAKKFLGAKYVLGTAGPKTYDCSGFVMVVMKEFGITLPHSAKEVGYNYGEKVKKDELRKGDLIFFNTVAGDGNMCDHMGIYMGDNEFIHASSGSAMAVTTSSLTGRYSNTFSWGRRVLK